MPVAALSDEVLARFRCPECRRPVTASDGGLQCEVGHRMPFRNGYLDASKDAADAVTAKTLQSFGYEWNAFSGIGAEDEKAWNEYFRDVPLDALTGKVGLDAGCGKGRFSRFTAGHLGWLVALDGSSAVDAASRNLADLENVTVVKSDLREVPFAAESFDFVSCLGVLHHLPDPHAGFRALVDLLAPGGYVLLYLYSRPDERGLRSAALSAAARARVVTVRLPHRVLRALSAPLAAALYSGFVLPGAVGSRLGVGPLERLPLAPYRGRPLRSLWLDTFDRLSAPVEKRYVWSELRPWFEAAGLRVEAVREEAGYYIVASKPGDGASEGPTPSSA